MSEHDTRELKSQLSSANAKIAELEATVRQAERDATEATELMTEMRTIRDDALEQNLELATKVEKLTGYLAHEATLNLELAATVEKLKPYCSHITTPQAPCGYHFVARRKLNGQKGCICGFEDVLSLTPSSALLAHDLELAERVYKEALHSQFHLPEVDTQAALQVLWLASQTRRSLTEGNNHEKT